MSVNLCPNSHHMAVQRSFLVPIAVLLALLSMTSADRLTDSVTVHAEPQLVSNIIASASTLNLPPSFFRLQLDEAPDPVAYHQLVVQKPQINGTPVNDLPVKRDKHPFLAVTDKVTGKFCEGYGCKPVTETDDYLWHDPEAAEWLAVGNVSSLVQLRTMSEKMGHCFLGTCNQGLTCHPENSLRHHHDPSTFKWRIEGDFRVGGKVILRPGGQENCCLSVINGIYVTAQCYRPSVESKFKLPSAVWKVVGHGPSVGRWKEIHSGMNAAMNYKYIVGVTEKHGNAVSESERRALRSAVSAELGFTAPGGLASAKGSATVELSVDAAHGVQASFDRSIHKEEVHEFWCMKSGARPEGKFWMWQFVVSTPRAVGKPHDPDVLETYTPEIICTFGDASTRGKVVPQCPLAYCADENCQTCHEGWQGPR